MLSKFIIFFRSIKNLIKLGSVINSVYTDKNSNIVINFNNNILLTTPTSFGIHADKNIIFESSFLSENFLADYDNALNINNTLALMGTSYDILTADISEIKNMEYLFSNNHFYNHELQKLIEN